MRHFNRLREVKRLRALLERDGYPRLQMALLVAITGAAGFVISYVLLNNGMTSMWLRYLIAFCAAYVVFLTLLWLWLRTRAKDYSDIPDLLSNAGPPRSGQPIPQERGGEYGGGGASGRYDAPETTPTKDTGPFDTIGDAVGSVADADELAIPLIALVVLGALLVSSVWVIYAAPILFAELLVDGVLTATLYRRLRGLQPRHWLETAVRRTIVPFIVTTTIAVVVGWGLGKYNPDATSIGDIVFSGETKGNNPSR